MRSCKKRILSSIILDNMIVSGDLGGYEMRFLTSRRIARENNREEGNQCPLLRFFLNGTSAARRLLRCTAGFQPAQIVPSANRLGSVVPHAPLKIITTGFARVISHPIKKLRQLCLIHGTNLIGIRLSIGRQLCWEGFARESQRAERRQKLKLLNAFYYGFFSRFVNLRHVFCVCAQSLDCCSPFFRSIVQSFLVKILEICLLVRIPPQPAQKMSLTNRIGREVLGTLVGNIAAGFAGKTVHAI